MLMYGVGVQPAVHQGMDNMSPFFTPHVAHAPSFGAAGSFAHLESGRWRSSGLAIVVDV